MILANILTYVIILYHALYARHFLVLPHGLLQDDQEWAMCLEEAAHMQTGTQLRSLFCTILADCTPYDPVLLWSNFREHICDDLKHALSRHGILNATEEQIYDYGLYLIEQKLSQTHKSLSMIPGMPMSVLNWDEQFGNKLFQEQRNYNAAEQANIAIDGVQSLNDKQQQAFEEVCAAVNA